MQRFQNKTALKRKVETPLCDTWLVEHMRGPPSVFLTQKRTLYTRAAARARAFLPPVFSKSALSNLKTATME